MPKGGTRAGAGRKAGSANQKSVEVIANAISAGKSPVEFMLEIMRDETKDMKERAWAAEKAAPFVHARPAPIHRAVSISVPEILSAGDIPAGISAIMQAMADGQISPGEAQSIVSIVEAQRKAIETADLLKRIELLEAKS